MIEPLSYSGSIVRLTGVGEPSSHEALFSCVEPMRESLKSSDEIERSLANVQRSKASGVLLNQSILARPNGIGLARRIREGGQTPVVSIPLALEAEQGTEALRSAIEWSQAAATCHLAFLIHDNSDLTPQATEILKSQHIQYHLTVVLSRWLDLDALLEDLSAIYRKQPPHIYLPPEQLTGTDGLELFEAFQIIERARIRHPGFTPRSSLFEVWDPEAPQTCELDHRFHFDRSNHENDQNRRVPILSVVISSKPESVEELIKDLKIFEQRLHYSTELIILLDQQAQPCSISDRLASEVDLPEDLDKWLSETRIPAQIFSIQHGSMRLPKGLVWNAGAQAARGSLIIFCEDRLPQSEQFLREIALRHERGEAMSGSLGNPRKYSNNFNLLDTDDISAPKLSACASVNAQDFKNMGGFSNAASWYGCELADLALRLRNEGRKAPALPASYQEPILQHILYRSTFSPECLTNLRFANSTGRPLQANPRWMIR